MLYQAVYKAERAVAIRYPRGCEPEKPADYIYEKESCRLFGDASAKTCLVTYGREFANCYAAMQTLEDTCVLKLNRIKPIDPAAAEALSGCERIFFFEEGIKSGGVGECFAALLKEQGNTAAFTHIAVEDEFVKQAEVSAQIKRYQLDTDSIIQLVSQ